jgi:4-aminobutyrate aminotransferase/(S)-3-amino-2-methylpropionate transaminase
VAGVLVEPVQGEGGFVVPPPDFLPALARLCRESSVPLIVDEVQTGFGRTGRMFAIEHSQVEPDLIVLAKTLGGGMPLAAVVGRAELMDATAPGGLGGTFGGNPVACAGALAIIDVLLQERLPARADQIGRTAMERMRSWTERVPAIGEVRGLGAMVAMEVVKDRVSREPDPQLTTAILHRCHDRGLAILKAGLYDNVIRLLPPLTISDDELRHGLDILEESVSIRE